MADRRARLVARAHPVARPAVVRGALLQRPHHRDVLHPLRQLRQVLGEDDPRHRRSGHVRLAAHLRARLRVEGVEVRHAPRHVEIDQVLRLAAHRLLGDDWVGERHQAQAHRGLGEAFDESTAREGIEGVQGGFHGGSELGWAAISGVRSIPRRCRRAQDRESLESSIHRKAPHWPCGSCSILRIRCAGGEERGIHHFHPVISSRVEATGRCDRVGLASGESPTGRLPVPRALTRARRRKVIPPHFSDNSPWSTDHAPVRPDSGATHPGSTCCRRGRSFPGEGIVFLK